MSCVFQVQKDQVGIITAGGAWSIPAGSTAYYHKLNMGGVHRLCVLSGTVTTKWTQADVSEKVRFAVPYTGANARHIPSRMHSCTFCGQVIATLHNECTAGYNSFWVPANVKLDGKQQWVNGDASFQLRLTNDHKLALWTKATPSQQYSFLANFPT